MYQQPDGLWLSVWATRYTPVEGWGTPVPIENADDEDADRNALTVDPNWRVTVGARATDEVTQSLRLARPRTHLVRGFLDSALRNTRKFPLDCDLHPQRVTPA